VNRAMTRLYGRAPTGARVLGRVPQHEGPTGTLWGTRGAQGLQAVMTVDGATAAEGFRPEVTPGLGPTRTPGALLVLDTWPAHNAVGVPQAMARRGARRLYVPPYAPDLSPSAPCGSTVKTARRQVKARTRAGLDAAIAEAMLTVSHPDAWGWFKPCGDP
jgi:transposase